MCLFTIGMWVLIELLVQFIHYHHACVGGEGEWHGLGGLVGTGYAAHNRSGEALRS